MAEYIVSELEHGTVNISDEVICHIVKDAIKDMEGIGGISTTGAGIAEMVGLKYPIKGLRVEFQGNTIVVDLTITVNYGFNIVEVASKAQESISSEIESSTGIQDVQVNINVSGINFA